MRFESVHEAPPNNLVDAIMRGRDIALMRSEPVGSAAGISIKIVRDLIGLNTIEVEWRDLESRIEGLSFFASFDWTRAWWGHFGNQGVSSLAVVTARLHGRLVAVVPLIVDCAGPYSWASPAGSGSGRYSSIAIDPDVDDKQLLQAALWDGIRRCGADTLVADNVPANAELAALLVPRRKLAHSKNREFEVIARNYAGIDDYLASKPTRFNETLRQARDRLAEQGPVNYEVISEPKAIAAAVETMVGFKHAWFAERGLSGRFLSRPEVSDWLKELSVRAAGRLHLSLLRVGETIVAAQFAFIDGNRLTCYFAAFDIRYARQSVGKLHLEDLVRENFETGLDIDLMPPADDYKREWGTPGADTFSASVPLTPLGTVVTLFHNARLGNARLGDRVKRVYLAMPHWLPASMATRLQQTGRWFASTLNRDKRLPPPQDHPANDQAR